MRLLIAIFALLLASACGSERETPTPEPERAAPAPAPEVATPEPKPAGPDPERGAAQYATLCASCHGPRGGGDGPIAASLDPKPADHSNGAVMNALSDETLFRVISEGGSAVGKSPLMAPWGGTLSDDDIRDVIAFIRTLADPPYRAPSG